MEKYLTSFLEYWGSLDLDQAPFVTNEDKQAINIDDHYTCTSYEEFVTIVGKENVKGKKEDFFDKRKLHLGLIPQPFIGDLNEAQIFILSLNPGFGPGEYFQENSQNNKDFRNALLKNLKQQPSDYPFVFFDPRFLWTSGGVYWRTNKGFKDTIQALCEFKGISYLDALAELSRKIATIELIPYHSASTPDIKDMANLDSARRMRIFVREVLVPRARAGKAVIICTRQVKAWDLNPADKSNIVLYPKALAQSASLGRGSPAWSKISEILKLETN